MAVDSTHDYVRSALTHCLICGRPMAEYIGVRRDCPCCRYEVNDYEIILCNCPVYAFGKGDKTMREALGLERAEFLMGQWPGDRETYPPF